jgi:hypothetical protein
MNLQNCLYHPKQKPRWGGGLMQADKHLPQSPFTGKIFFITKFGTAFYQSNLSTSTPLAYERYRTLKDPNQNKNAKQKIVSSSFW